MLNIACFHNVALLIDADNIQLKHLEQILQLSAYYGNLKISRAYGDWRQPPLDNFHNAVNKLTIDCVQVNRIAKKDTTDKQLMIEAGEILGAGDADLFIIASGDGDFRLLCERIRHKNRKVVGIGNKAQTSPELPKICDAFYYIEHLEEILIQLEQHRPQESTQVIDSEGSEHLALLQKAYAKTQRNGLAHIGQLGQVLREMDSKFESHFGKVKLSKWLKKYPHVFTQDGHYISLSKS